MVKKILQKIKRKWVKTRLQPISVYCLHHVCKTYDDSSMKAVDWMQLDEFKYKVSAMREAGIVFISMTEAYQHICEDQVRSKKFAVLTFDDGYASLNEILPWLEEQKIPATLFINGKYLDGKSYRETPKERYLAKEELWKLTSPLIEIGSHGWEHIDARLMSLGEFIESERKNEDVLCKHDRYIPFYAYTYGGYNEEQDAYLHSIGQVPILIDKADNYNDKRYIHRRLL